MDSNKRKAWNIAGIVLLCVVLTAAGFATWFSNNYETVLKERIPGWVKKGTHGVYNVSVEDISINIFTRNATVQGIKLWPDSGRISKMNPLDAPATTFNISVPILELSDIKWADIIADKDVVVGRLTINNADIKIHATPKLVDSLEQKKADSLLANEEKKQPRIDRLYAGEIILNNPNITYEHNDSGKILNCYLIGGKINLLEWEFNSDKPKAMGRFFYAKKAVIAIDSLLYRNRGGLYDISSSHLDLITDKNSLAVKNLRIKTQLSKEAFYKKVGRQQDLFDMEFPVMNFTEFKWQAMMDSGQLIAASIELQDARLEDHFTRMAPPNMESKIGKFPNQLLLKLPLDIYIQEIKTTNGSFKYTEVNEKSKRAGELVFDNIKGRITNVTNMPQQIRKNSQCILALNGNFNGKSPISATFKLSLADTMGTFSVDGSLRNLDAPQVNETAKALALAKIDSLHISKLTLHVEGNQNYGKGNITLLYNNLKVSLLDTNQKPRGVEPDKKNFLSFVANSFLLFPANPMLGKDVRSEGDYITRDPYKSFFNLIWKTIFNSAQKTAIRSDNIAELLEENQTNKGKKKKGFFKRLFGKKDKGDKDKKDSE